MKALLKVLLIASSIFAPTIIWGQTAKTDAALLTQMNTIKNETNPSANTPARIGTALLDIIASKSNNQYFYYATASGTNTYTASITPAITTYTAGLAVKLKFTNANTGASTINLNSLGAKSIKKLVNASLVTGDILNNEIKILIYDGTNFQLVTGSSSGGGGSAIWGAVSGTLYDQTDLGTALTHKLSDSLISARIYVGNGSNHATAVAVTGDITLSNAGVVSVTKLIGNTIPANSSGVLTNNGSGTLTWGSAGTTYSADESTVHLASTTFSVKAGGITGTELSSTVAIPSAATATTQSQDANSTAIATTEYADRLKYLRFNRQTGDYTLVLTDAYAKVVEINSSSPHNLTVPTNASVAFPIGTIIEVTQYGTGQVTIVAAGGVTLRSSSGSSIVASRYNSIILEKVGADEWYSKDGAPAIVFSNGLTPGTNTVQLGGAITADMSFTGSFNWTQTHKRYSYTSTYTAQSNNDFSYSFAGTGTARSTSSDNFDMMLENITVVSAAASQTITGKKTNVTFTDVNSATQYIQRWQNAGSDRLTLKSDGTLTHSIPTAISFAAATIVNDLTTKVNTTTTSAKAVGYNFRLDLTGSSADGGVYWTGRFLTKSTVDEAAQGFASNSSTINYLFLYNNSATYAIVGPYFSATSTSASSLNNSAWTVNGLGTNTITWRINTGHSATSGTPTGLQINGTYTPASGTATTYIIDGSPTYNFGAADFSGANIYFAKYAPVETSLGTTPAKHYGLVINSTTTLNGFNAGATPTSILHVGAGSSTISQMKFNSTTLLSTIVAGDVGYNGNWYASTSGLNRLGLIGNIKDFTADVNNSSTTETDLYTYTTKASTLAVDGDQIEFTGTLTVNDATATAQIRFYFAGTTIGDTGALTPGSGLVPLTWTVIVKRTSSTTARTTVWVGAPGFSVTAYLIENDLTSLTLSGTNIIKVTGTAGGASGGSNDITAKHGVIKFVPSANN